MFVLYIKILKGENGSKKKLNCILNNNALIQKLSFSFSFQNTFLPQTSEVKKKSAKNQAHILLLSQNSVSKTYFKNQDKYRFPG